MAKFKVLQKCYYGEGNKKARLMYPGDIYESTTLKGKDIPKYLQPIGGKDAAPAPVAAPVAPEGEGDMTYHEMKSFVSDNGIQVPDYKKETMEAAIASFKAGGSEEVAEAAPEGEGEEVAEVPAEVAED
jgi:hypothetical protein